MKTFETDLKAYYKKFENNIKYIISHFPKAKQVNPNSFYNTIILEFNSQEYMEAQEIASNNFLSTSKSNESFTHKFECIDFEMITYPKTNCLKFIF